MARRPRPADSRASLRGVVPEATFRGVHLARELMQDRFREKLTLDDLAAVAGLSPFHLIRVFRRVYGDTPHQHLVHLRLAKAKELLARHAWSVTDACFEVGFSSLGSFSSTFTRAVGASPQVYQRSRVRLFQMPRVRLLPAIPSCFLAYFGGNSGGAQFSRSAAASP